jgi:hypothetical protein
VRLFLHVLVLPSLVSFCAALLTVMRAAIRDGAAQTGGLARRTVPPTLQFEIGDAYHHQYIHHAPARVQAL